MSIVVFTGGFDPVHSGHVEAIKEARKLGRVVLGLNSDEWLVRKKGRCFMPFNERMSVLSQFKDILAVIGFDDADGSACDCISQVCQMFPNESIIFVNGGDRTQQNIPEMDRFADDPQVSFVFGVGGSDKKNSSSWILSEWRHPSVARKWGKYITCYESINSGVKVKRLTILPGQSISMQYHNHRSEVWFVESGCGTVYTLDGDRETTVCEVAMHDRYIVETQQWHRLENTGDCDLCIVEIQYGEMCNEEDIVRFASINT